MPEAPPPPIKSVGEVTVEETPRGPVVFSYSADPVLTKAQALELSAHLAEIAEAMPDEPDAD